MLSELTPILWDPVSLGILVVKPDITTVSLVFKVCVVEINPETVPFPPRTRTTSLYVVIPTVTLSTSLPCTFICFSAIYNTVNDTSLQITYHILWCWPPLISMCHWPQLQIGLGVGPKSYLLIDRCQLTLPLLIFTRYFSYFTHHVFTSPTIGRQSILRLS